MHTQNTLRSKQRQSLWYKRVVTVLSAACLGAIYSWLACFEPSTEGASHFHWRWMALLWIIIGVGSSTFFWHKIWPPSHYPIASRNGIIKGLVMILVPMLWWLTLPLRHLVGERCWNIITAFAAVAMALSYGAWMITRLLKFFESSDEYDLKILSSDEQNIK
jgi:hypothetical protein